MKLATALAAGTLIALPARALAWGAEGHKIIAAIAQSYLTPAAKTQVDALLAADADTLTPPDLLSRATWADAWRNSHRETASWHFVDIELDEPDLAAACFGFPASGSSASAGPAADCVVDKLDEFVAELANSANPQPERIIALKFVLHFVGDLHQPLHASDNHDRGGNCVRLSLGGPRTTNLHSYWDTTIVQVLGSDLQADAAQLRAEITPALKAGWELGDARAWAMESYAVAKARVYAAGFPSGCAQDAAPVPLPSGYDREAQRTGRVQLQRAGVRLALILNRALR